MYEAIIDVADQLLLPSVCSWEGCLGGPSSPWARPAAFFWEVSSLSTAWRLLAPG